MKKSSVPARNSKSPSSLETLLYERLPNLLEGEIGQFLRLAKECQIGLVSLGFQNNCCWPGFYRNGSLTVYCQSSTWASLLRYQTHELQNYLANQPTLPTIQTIKVSVNKPLVPRVQDFFQPKRIPQAAAEILHNTALQVTDPELRSSLHRLASRFTSG